MQLSLQKLLAHDVRTGEVAIQVRKKVCKLQDTRAH